jgi:hypothetical protein
LAKPFSKSQPVRQRQEPRQGQAIPVTNKPIVVQEEAAVTNETVEPIMVALVFSNITLPLSSGFTADYYKQTRDNAVAARATRTSTVTKSQAESPSKPQPGSAGGLESLGSDAGCKCKSKGKSKGQPGKRSKIESMSAMAAWHFGFMNGLAAMKFPPHIGGNEFAGIGGNEGHKRQGTRRRQSPHRRQGGEAAIHVVTAACPLGAAACPHPVLSSRGSLLSEEAVAKQERV